MTAIYILCSCLMPLVASRSITKRSPSEIYDRRNSNEIFVGETQHKKACEVSVSRHRGQDMITCTRTGEQASTELDNKNIAHSCNQTYIYHGDQPFPSGCALYLGREGKHAKETEDTKECVDGERGGSLGIHQVFFVQEEIQLPHGHVTAGCSTYLKD